MSAWDKYVGQEQSMNGKSKLRLIALGCFVALAAIEQAGWINLHYARTVSHTGSKVGHAPGVGDLSSTVRVERPVTRWLPFIKFGETVHWHTAQSLESNTSTSLWVFGLCSTARYDELANKPFEGELKRLSKKR
jgi:hypothetical protein